MADGVDGGFDDLVGEGSVDGMTGDLPAMSRRGHFRLESGHHGNLWLDLDTLFRRPARLRPAARALARRLAARDADLVCGPLTGGAFLAQLVAAELDAEFCYTVRDAAPSGDAPGGALYRARYVLAPGTAPRGRRVAVVDDAVNAGSAVRATLAALRDAGAEPVAIGALLVLGGHAAELADREGLALERLSYLPNELWAPRDCPMCAAGVPLTDLTSP